MKARAATLTLLFGVSSLAMAQATPAVTATTPTYTPGVTLPLIDGNFQYAVSVSEILQSGYASQNGGIAKTTNLSGDVEYLSKSQSAPFSLLYAGGYLITSDSTQQSSTYQSLSISQGLLHGPWTLGVADSVSYLPNAPSTGLSGVPGVGDLGLPVTTPDLPAQDVLSNYVSRVSNSVSGNIGRKLDGRTSISGSASYGILRFIDGGGLDSNQVNGTVSANRQLDRRNTVSLSAAYGSFSYVDNSSSFDTRQLYLTYERQWSRRVTTSVSGGPEWISSFESQPFVGGPTTATAVPSRLTVSADASITYSRRFTTAVLSYDRSANNGSGVQIGAIGDTVRGAVNRSFGRDWSASVSASYARSVGLVNLGDTTTVFGGAQANRRISQRFSAYVSYTIQDQHVNGALLGLSPFVGVSNIGAIGITFAPRAARLGQF
jgi:hypothetical protein